MAFKIAHLKTQGRPRWSKNHTNSSSHCAQVYKREAPLPPREQGVSLVHSSPHIASLQARSELWGQGGHAPTNEPCLSPQTGGPVPHKKALEPAYHVW